ncbi:putative Metalloprotease [Candidatus Zixiibacteriota bacterium]|nr:putative Metalloprotease [candidate division Zixibacteria bacterium]
MRNPEQVSKQIYYQLADLFDISAIYYHDGRIILKARPYFARDEALGIMQRRLKQAGYEGAVKEDPGGLLIGIREIATRKFPYVNIILFAATLVTMFFAPLFFEFNLNFLRRPGGVMERVEFTVALILILLFHEFGHYLVGRRRGVLMSLPYFIPAPNIVGTFGAVIKSRSPFTNRRDLIEVGAAGPIAGFVIATIVLTIGLWHAKIIPVEMDHSMRLGDSLLIKILAQLVRGGLPQGYDFAFSPAIFAGWVGLLVTMLNLLPIGQLDGGHILYGMVGKYQGIVAKIFLIFMLVLGFKWPGWWIFGAFVFIFGLRHPPTFNDALPPSPTAKLMGYASLVIFIISFIPVPFIVK